MKRWKNCVVAPTDTIRRAMEIIDVSALQLALVVDEGGTLVGIVTDGDIRRAILANCDLSASVAHAMTSDPIVAKINDSRERNLARMSERAIHHIPIVDETGRLVGLDVLDDLLAPSRKENLVVLMAGGDGKRLRPLTDSCPKPMLKVGGKPIMEIVLENFLRYGLQRFRVAVRYHGEMIKNYFGDGTKWGVEIEYIEEEEALGTAGALSLLPQAPQEPFFVMNTDLLTEVNLDHMMSFHTQYDAAATMGVKEYDFQIPYGVITVDDSRIRSIEEKPTHRFFVNAGLYILNPSVLEAIPKGRYLDMPDLFRDLIEQKGEAIAFPVREYWLDIGRTEDFARANIDYGEDEQRGREST